MLLVYDFDIVGGEFDGAPALAWMDDGKHPLPDLIFVGVCGRGRDCGTSKCRPDAAHISYWLAAEQDRPPDALPYSKQDEHVRRAETPDPDGGEQLRGRAVYAVGGLLDPRNFGEAARVPEGSEPVVLASAPDLIGALRSRIARELDIPERYLLPVSPC